MTAISVEAVDVGKQFGAFAALADVTFHVKQSAVHALLGENGAGKFTLVKCLFSYDRADQGSFVIDGRDADRLVGPRMPTGSASAWSISTSPSSLP